MSRHYRPYTPEQPHLLPCSPQDWLPADDVAYQVRDLVAELDLSAFDAVYLNKDPRGGEPLDPRMMVGILLYAWSQRVYSSRQIMRLCRRDLGARYLAAGYQPNWRTISAFQLAHGEALADLFVQSVKLCMRAGMVSLIHVATDGTKLEANASKHKAMSYGRMQVAEEQIRREINQLQGKARQLDAEEDGLFGKDNAGLDVPAEIQLRQSRLGKIVAARQALEAEARAAAEAKAAGREAKEAATGKRLGGKKPKPPEDAKPAEKAQRNFTDPESRIMKAGSGAYIQGYNGQLSVDRDHQVIVGCDLDNQAADAPHFVPMMRQVEENTGATPAERSADAGYFSAANVADGKGAGAENFIPPDRLKHGEAATSTSVAAEVAHEDELSVAEWMRRLLSTPEGREAYGWRKKVVEAVIGQIKGCPGSPGFWQILRRGLVKARQEWRWQCATHNFRKLLRYRCACGAAA